MVFNQMKGDTMSLTEQRSEYIESTDRECKTVDMVEARNVVEKMAGNEGRGKVNSDFCRAMDSEL